MDFMRIDIQIKTFGGCIVEITNNIKYTNINNSTKYYNKYHNNIQIIYYSLKIINNQRIGVAYGRNITDIIIYRGQHLPPIKQ